MHIWLVPGTVLVGVLIASVGGASPGSPLAAPSGNPQAMPGDYFDIPQSAQLKVPLGPPAGPNRRIGAGTQISDPQLGFALSLAAAEAARQSCAADGYTVTVAVTDDAGNLKVALAGDGVRTNGVFMAMHKAVTVVAFRMSTLDLRMKIEKDPSLMTRITPNMSLLPGGLPIYRNGAFVGAIATSGVSAYQEEKCAKDGLRRIHADL